MSDTEIYAEPPLEHYYVYEMTCPKCKLIYVGRTKNLESRRKKHNRDLKTSNRYVYCHLRSCGCRKIPPMEVVEETHLFQMAEEIEKTRIRDHGELNGIKYYLDCDTNRWAQWYFKNREKRLKTRRERVQCPHCLNMYNKEYLPRHIRNNSCTVLNTLLELNSPA